MHSFIPSWTALPTRFQTVAIYAVASVVYHLEYLERNLPKSHAFFCCQAYRKGILSNWSKTENLVVTGSFESTMSNMRATGLPPHTILAKELSDVKAEIAEFRKSQDRYMSVLLGMTLQTSSPESVRDFCNIFGDRLITLQTSYDRIEQTVCEMDQTVQRMDRKITLCADKNLNMQSSVKPGNSQKNALQVNAFFNILDNINVFKHPD
jgi:hypothetical protein